MNFNLLNGRLIFSSKVLNEGMLPNPEQHRLGSNHTEAYPDPEGKLKAVCISLEGIDNVPESGSSQHPTHRQLCAPAVLCSGFSLSHSLTQTPTGFGDQARVPQSVALRDLICVMWFFPPLSSSGRRCVQLMAEALGEVSIKRRNPFSFLDVCCFSLFLMPVFSPPGYRYCLQHPPRWNQTRGFSRPCTWSVCCFLCHILCPAVQAYVCWFL